MPFCNVQIESNPFVNHRWNQIDAISNLGEGMIQVAHIRTMQQFSVPVMTLHSLSMRFRRQRHLLSTSTAPRCQWNLQSSFFLNCQKHFVSSSYVTHGTLIQEKHVSFHVIHCLLRIENLSVFESSRLGCDLIVFRLSLFVVYLAS